jgi:uncharacterized protein (DUF1800 family)
MAYAVDRVVEHLLLRAGFGARPDERETYARLSLNSAIDRLVDYEEIPDDVDSKIGRTGYLGTTNSQNGVAFNPRIILNDARQRWLFRMVHTDRPLQEKMTLFWHNHFATAHSKINGMLGVGEATRYMAAKASEDPQRVRGQIEMLRENALGNFEEILINISKDVAMMYWLDGRLNTRVLPQENFGREIMELFTMGVGNYTEADVYAAARVFTGWNLISRGSQAARTQYFEFFYNGAQHETAAKTFSFPVYPDGSRTIPARSGATGMQDGLDLIAGLVRHPATGRYLATKLYRFFVSETGDVNSQFVERIANVYANSQHDMKAVVKAVLLSPEFWDESAYSARFSWPVEFVARVLKQVASRRYQGFSAINALTPLSNMGLNLYDPPDVAGWDLGRGWFSTGSMLARMNFAATVASNQRIQLVEWMQNSARTPDQLVTSVLDALAPDSFDGIVRAALANYLRSTGPWTGTPAQLTTKIPGLVHLVTGAAEYQLV